MASTLVSYSHGVRLSQITSLQLPWHRKRYMSIGHKYMSIRPVDEQKCPLDIQMSIRSLDEWTLSNGKHSSLLSTWGQTQSNYVITASLAS